MKHREQSHSRSPGFTLVEVMIGLSLLGMTLAVLYSGLFGSARALHVLERASEDNDNRRIALSFIRKQITQVVPIVYHDTEKTSVFFFGEGDNLHFISRLPAYLGGTDLYSVALRIDTGTDGPSLAFHYTPLHPEYELLHADKDRHEYKQALTLLEGIDALEISYYGSKEIGREPEWHREWQVDDRLPALLRIHLIASDPDTYWPALSVAIPVRVEPGQPQSTLLLDTPLAVP